MPALPPLRDLPLSQTLASTPSSAPGRPQRKGKCSQNRLTTSPVSGADTSSLEVLSTALSCSWLQILRVACPGGQLPQKWDATTEVTKRYTRGLEKKKKRPLYLQFKPTLPLIWQGEGNERKENGMKGPEHPSSESTEKKKSHDRKGKQNTNLKRLKTALDDWTPTLEETALYSLYLFICPCSFLFSC